ncbi:MAG TPA: hypothetical protein VGG88_01795, partial [Gaiellaceae bacterium]
MAEIVGPGAEGTGRDHDGGRLRREPEAPREGSAEGPQRGPLGSLAPRERRAFGALAQMGAQLRLLGARERPVELLRDRELGIGAGQRAFELLAQCAACAEDECLDRARREAEHVGDLRVRASLDLAEDDCGALVERQVTERAPDVLRRGAVVVDELVGDVVVELDLLRAPRRAAEAMEADIVRDLDQPVERRARILAALERPVRVEERRLRDV